MAQRRLKVLLLSLPTATSDRQCLYCHKQLTKFVSLVAYQQFHTYSICKLTVTGHFGDVYIYIDLHQLKLQEATVISCSQSTTHLLLYEWSRMGIGDTRRRRSWVKWGWEKVNKVRKMYIFRRVCTRTVQIKGAGIWGQLRWCSSAAPHVVSAW